MISLIQQGEVTRAEIIAAIKLYHSKHGYAPSIRDLCKMVGLKSSSTVHKHLGILKEEGRIEWNPDMPRTIRTIK
jgi:repressor LexA